MAPFSQLLRGLGCIWFLYATIVRCANATNETASTSSSLQITISTQDSDGNDVSNSISVLHYEAQLPNSPSALRKRSSRAIDSNYCKDPNFANIFIFSQCLRQNSLREWAIVCEGHPEELGGALQAQFGNGSCDENEICIDTLRNGVQMAYCVHTDNFVPIVNMLQDKVPQTVTANVNKNAKTNANWTLEAVLAGIDNETALNAEHLDMEAQTYDTVFNVPTWRTVAGGLSECTNCSSVALERFPVSAKRIKVDVVLPASITAGFLYLASVAYAGS